MKNKWKKNIFAFLFFSVVMSIPIIKTINYRKLPYTGTRVEGTAYVGSRYITWKYSVDGSMYKVRISKSDYPFIVDGEKYNVYYNPKSPSTSIMVFSEPIIEPLVYDTINSLPLTAEYNKGIEVVNFCYLINGDTIKRKHQYKFKNDFSSTSEKFIVYVKSDNPAISYIKLEK